jgi:hypothetical protein
MMHHRVFVLQDGSLILGCTEWEQVNYEAYTQEIHNPVKLEIVRFQDSKMVYETLVIKAWLPMMATNSVHLQTAQILTCFPIKSEYEEQYKMYIAAKEASDMEEKVSGGPQFDVFTNRDNVEETTNGEMDDYIDEEFFEEPAAPKRVLH